MDQRNQLFKLTNINKYSIKSEFLQFLLPTYKI